MMKSFAGLSQKEILAVAISNEEDCRVYLDIADGLHEQFPSSATVFQEMAAEETGHRNKFGEFLPLIRRQDCAASSSMAYLDGGRAWPRRGARKYGAVTAM
jgi:rubrerythrin